MAEYIMFGKSTNSWSHSIRLEHISGITVANNKIIIRLRGSESVSATQYVTDRENRSIIIEIESMMKVIEDARNSDKFTYNFDKEYLKLLNR